MIRRSQTGQPRPIFIIGSYRSATSAMTWAMGQHPNIFPLEETHFLYKLAVDLDYLYEIGTAQREHSFLGVAGYTQEQFRAHFSRSCHDLVLQARRRIEMQSYDAALRDRSRISDKVKLSRKWWHRKGRWIDGTPENSHYVLSLSRLFPEAKFIHILRNPGRVASSLMHFSKVGARDYPEQEAYETWTRLVRDCAVSEQALGSSRVMRLLHEDLVNNPREVVTRCLAFAGESYHPDCLLPLTQRINSSGHTEDGDCSIEANIQSSSPWISTAYALYKNLIEGMPFMAGGTGAAMQALRSSLDNYRESLRPDINEALTLAFQALQKQRDDLWNRLDAHQLPLEIIDWGPRDIVAGVGFNLQGDGSSALWIRTRHAPENTAVHLDGIPLPSAAHADGSLVTAIVPAALTQHPCTLQLCLKTVWSARDTPVIPVRIHASHAEAGTAMPDNIPT